MKRKDLDKLNSEELKNRAKEVEDELFQARLKFRLGQFKKTSEFPRLRREIARIKTLIRERQDSSAKEGAA